MYISRFLQVDTAIPFKGYQLARLKKNKPLKQYYVLCTSEQYLFEIIAGNHLTQKYATCYVLGLSEDKSILVEQVASLVDTLYNQKTVCYEDLKTT